VILLRFLEERPGEDVAEALDLSRGHVVATARPVVLDRLRQPVTAQGVATESRRRDRSRTWRRTCNYGN
jgi:hypothetical protein